MPCDDAAGEDAPEGPVPVWDRWVRITHWMVAGATLLAYFSHGGLLQLHRVTGYVTVALVVGRLAWGIVGTTHARLVDFVPAPRQLLAHLWNMGRWRDERFLGHNPAGAVMILALWAVLLSLGASGWMLDSPAYRDYRPLQEIHAILADLLMLMIALHVAGVLLASWRHRENLIVAMVTGKKRGSTSRRPTAP